MSCMTPTVSITITFPEETIEQMRRLAGDGDVGRLIVHGLALYLDLAEKASQGFTDLSIGNPRTGGSYRYTGPLIPLCQAPRRPA